MSHLVVNRSSKQCKLNAERALENEEGTWIRILLTFRADTMFVWLAMLCMAQYRDQD